MSNQVHLNSMLASDEDAEHTIRRAATRGPIVDHNMVCAAGKYGAGPGGVCCGRDLGEPSNDLSFVSEHVDKVFSRKQRPTVDVQQTAVWRTRRCSKAKWRGTIALGLRRT